MYEHSRNLTFCDHLQKKEYGVNYYTIFFFLFRTRKYVEESKNLKFEMILHDQEKFFGIYIFNMVYTCIYLITIKQIILQIKMIML